MVPGDVTDYFHVSGLTADELRAQDYQVWMDPQPAGEWISEGDTTNMLNLLVPGLRGHENPAFGGWGGRYEPTPDRADTWGLVDAAFRPGGAEWAGGAPTGDEASVTRWFADIQSDFAARLQWSVTPDYADANHHPRIEIREGIDLEVAAGEAVNLTAEVSDPDGDGVAVRWEVCGDAGTYAGGARLSAAEGLSTTVAVPADVKPGETIHVIAVAVDHAAQPLKSYRRVILTAR
jgi:hypothetical protein